VNSRKAILSSAKYPLALQLRYKAVSADATIFGTGRTNMMSSAELIFSADQCLEGGMKAEISIAWPVLLDGRVRLQLVIDGAIVRSEAGLTAVQIWKYHYRTRGPWAQEENRERIPLGLPVPPAQSLVMEHTLGARA
jgi:hypothetical protein